MTGVRLGVGGLGVAVAAYGVVRLLDLGVHNLVAAATWLVGGVVLHDGLLAPLTVGVGALLVRSRRLPAAAVIGLVVLGTVTLVAVPVLGRFGARPDNPTLLDRNYVLGWLALATLTVLYVGIAALAPRLRSKGGGHGAGAGRR
jgi:hypothetical protein